MGIQGKLLLTLLLLFAVMGSIGGLVLRHSVMRGYLQIEQEAASDDMARVVEGIQAEMGYLNDIVRDWAEWDELYRFAADRNQEFFQSNLSGNAATTSGNSLIAIFDTEGNSVALVGLDPRSGQAIQFSELQRADHPYRKRLTEPAPKHPDNCGLLRVQQGLMAVCWRNILTSQQQGPSHGTIAMGRLLGQSLLDRIRRQTKLDFSLQNSPLPAGRPQLGQHILKSPLGSAAIHYDSNDSEYRLYWPIQDIVGQAQGHIQLNWSRTISHHGQAAVLSSMIMLALLASLVGMGLVIIINSVLIRRFKNLHLQLRGITEQRSWQQRLSENKPDEIGSLARDVNALLGVIAQQVEELQRLSNTDALTGAANRRAYDLALGNAVAHHHRTGEPLSLIMLDVDHFKLYNDHYGHPAGDLLLQQLAQRLAECAPRQTDMLARIGGEEFALLLEHTDQQGAIRVAERILQRMEADPLPHTQSPTARWVTLSLGIVSVKRGDVVTTHQMHRKADQALYQAKQSGRNRACVSTEAQSDDAPQGEHPAS